VKLHLTLAATLVSALALLTAAPRIDQKLRAARDAIRAYTNALNLARLSLASKSRGLTEDSSFTQNLSWGYGHATGQALRGQLEPFVADAIGLFTLDCKTIARASLNPNQKVLCEPRKPPKNGELAWQLVGDDTILSHTTPIVVDRATFLLVTQLTLDAAWLKHSGEMRSAVHDLGLSIGRDSDSSGGTLLLAEGLSAQGYHLLNLKTSDPLLAIWPQILKGHRLDSWAGGLVAASLIAALLLMLRSSLAIRAREEAMRRFTTWCENPNRELLSPDQEWQAASEAVLRYGERQSQEIARFEESEQNLKSTVERQSETIRTLEQEQADNSQMQTLSLQLNSSRDGFIAHVTEVEAEADSVGVALSRELGAQSARLVELAESWSEGMSKQSPRKFIRSLAERATPNGNQLEDEVRLIVELSRRLALSSVDLSLKAESLRQKTRSVRDVAEFWRSLEETSPSGEEWLLDLVVEAQGLITTVTRRSTIVFQNLIDPNLTVNHLEMPKSFWVSLLYHLYLAVLPESGEVMLTVSSRLLVRDRELFLVIMLDDAATPETRTQPSSRHWTLAQRLVRPSPVKLSLLPSIGGRRPVSLRWPQYISLSAIKTPAVSANHEAKPDLL